ncbi:uncharacterized protein BP5553_05880 [Venustampulla echinocandica]|uniref:HhH-GPD domain-containing protein n=1 Tax=Venustampulla echinocandica TaxID=2656787 RepID=A0A370TLY2_9HELO|nr:uncharacterized protein BP5553_05880 [Venustampulla echinocandica]RDL36528.1 hypothetical protein BP5553_05880 [Venustampulla echinocandica]
MGDSLRPASADEVPGPWDVLPHGLGSSRLLFFPVSKAVPKPTAKLATQEPPGRSETTDPVTADLLNEPKTEEQLEQKVKLGVGEDGKEAKLEDSKALKSGVDTSTDVLHKVKDLVDADEKLQNNVKKSKNRYGVDHQNSPFPHHVMPTPQACEEVHRLLTGKHGKVTQPATIPRPSLEVTGCGEVPDLIDSLLRTLLSAATTSNNSNKAFQSLKDTFGMKNDTANWEAVHKAEVGKVIDAIRCGGLAVVKGNNIKKILDIVHKKNCDRRDALLEEKKTGVAANIPGLDDLTQQQKDTELARFAENPLSLDWVLDLKEDWQAMDELVKLPGIGIKTASCVLLFRLQRPSFAVDTHVWRHCKWLGWVPPKATRDQTFNHCNLRVPDELKYSLHQLFIAHGKNCFRCRANTSAGTEEWDKSKCPIDHLLNRSEKRKQPKNEPWVDESKAISMGRSHAKKRKNADDIEESDFEVATVKSSKRVKGPAKKRTKKSKSESDKLDEDEGESLANEVKVDVAKRSRAKKSKNADGTEGSDFEVTTTNSVKRGKAAAKTIKRGKTPRRKQPAKTKKYKIDNSDLPMDNSDIEMAEEEALEDDEGSIYEATEDEGSEYCD